MVKKVLDKSTEDGYYHYGTLVLTNEEYVDKLGKNIEVALKDYYEENNKYPVNYRLLNLPKLDKDVICNSQINNDGSIYLNNCSVNGEKVMDYTYGFTYKSYNIGDVVVYNDIDFYVIENSGINMDSVTLLKAEPFSNEEINNYGFGHIDKYTSYSAGTEKNIYGGMAYYSSETCGNIPNFNTGGCITDYNLSEIKYMIDNWEKEKFSNNELKRIDGFTTRIITLNELNNLGCLSNDCKNSQYSWLYSNDYRFWTMTSFSEGYVYGVSYDGKIYSDYQVYRTKVAVRPVINMYKNVLEIINDD